MAHAAFGHRGVGEPRKIGKARLGIGDAQHGRFLQNIRERVEPVFPVQLADGVELLLRGEDDLYRIPTDGDR